MSAGSVLLYIAAAILIVWGVAHIVPTSNVVAGFGPLSKDNRINITMEWVAEGLALVFVGLLVLLVTITAGPNDPVASLVMWAVAGFCIVVGAWMFIIGCHSSIALIRLCPLAVWHTLVERLKVDLILATETILRRNTFTTCESVNDVAKRPHQKTV
jgi:hypothetical protein